MGSRGAKLVLGALLLATIATALLLRDRFDAAALAAWIDGAGAAGPILFIAVYALATVLFLPGTMVTLAGGALFGPVLGTVYNLAGATLGAGLAFLVSRHLAAEWVESRVGGRLKQLKQGVEGEGWRFVAFVRLVPLFPFNLLNYALGLTRIPFSHYIVASLLFMLPGGAAFTYVGYAGWEALAGGEGVIQKGLLALALVATVAFVSRVVARRRGAATAGYEMLDVAALREQLLGGTGPLLVDVRGVADFTGELGHVHGALNLPVNELQDRAGELAAYTDRQIAIICHTDRRSVTAANLLAERGFTCLSVVRGGMVDWHRAGFPVAPPDASGDGD